MVIDKFSCQLQNVWMLDLEVIDRPAAAIAALDPGRARILAVLADPGSATTVADALNLPRQKVNYHLRILEEQGLVTLVEERPRRGLTERVMVATASAYVVSPEALGANAVDPSRTDRLSARYLVALASRMIAEMAALLRGADRAGKSLATLAVDSDIRFATAADRATFSAEITDAIASLTAKYHDERTPGGRWHRLVIAAYPRPGTTTTATRKD